jgi:hypothetical protein
MLSEKLLSRNIPDKEKRDRIIAILTKELYSHDYIISRTEAEKTIGLPITHNPEIESLITDLFYLYEDVTKIGMPFQPTAEFQEALKSNGEMLYKRAFVEADEKCYCFISQMKFDEIGVQRPGFPFKEKIIKSQELFQGWREINE